MARILAIPNPVLITRGTGPGDPIEDIVFNLIFNLIIRQIQAQVQNKLPLPWIGDPKPADHMMLHDIVPSKVYMVMAFLITRALPHIPTMKAI